MPVARVPSIDAELASSSSPVNIFTYDHPPGPDRAVLPSRRRSWVDVVDQCSEPSTGTDLCSIDDSRRSTESHLDGKRRSWEQLIQAPSPVTTPIQLPLPYANPALHMMTIRDDGRLARVHLYNKKRSAASADNNDKTMAENGTSGKSQTNRREGSSGSSKTSTMSEFILVPSKTALTSSSTSSSADDLRFRHDFGKRKKRSVWSLICPWPPSRRTIFLIVLTVGLLLTSAVGGYLLRRFMVGRTAQYTLTFPSSQGYLQSNDPTLRLVVNQPDNARFILKGSTSYQDAKMVANFDKKLLLSHHFTGHSYFCFLSQLDQSSFPNIDILKEAAENALGNEKPVSMTENWRWRSDRVTDGTLRDTYYSYFDSEFRSECGSNLYWLQRVDQDTAAVKCVDCWSVCLPSYGRDASGGRPVLTLTGRDCFWIWSGSNPVPVVPNPIVNNFNNGGDPQQQQQPRPGPMDRLAFLNYPQQPQQTWFMAYPNRQPFQNAFNPVSPNGPTAFNRRP